MASSQIGEHKKYNQRVKLLLKHGANINAQDCEGRTALHNAYYIPEIFETLLKYNPNIHLKNNKGNSIVDLCKEPHKGMFANNIKKSCRILRNYMNK